MVIAVSIYETARTHGVVRVVIKLIMWLVVLLWTAQRFQLTGCFGVFQWTGGYWVFQGPGWYSVFHANIYMY